ncbi:FxsA family protein, partial [Actinomadura luteofluorescens]
MLPLLIVLAFLLVPVLEIFVLIQVGEVIGAWPTVGLLIAETALGACHIHLSASVSASNTPSGTTAAPSPSAA